jgi:enoyl-CoA hydratase/carnithine racemase
MNPTTFRYEERDGVATVTLDRPETLNSLTFEIYAELETLFLGMRLRRDVRAIVLTGEGRGFCSGGNVHDIIARLFERDSPALLDFTRMTGAVVRNMRACPQPIVAAVNGTAAGAGAVLALASDIRLASENAKFAFLFVKVGLAGADMGAAFLLPRVVGLGRATEMLLLGDTVSAADAERFGLVSRVLPPDRLMDEARALARRLAEGTGMGLAMTKEMIHRELSMTLDDAIEAEAQAQALCMRGPDFREFYDAFVGKRPPRFAGR